MKYNRHKDHICKIETLNLFESSTVKVNVLIVDNMVTCGPTRIIMARGWGFSLDNIFSLFHLVIGGEYVVLQKLRNLKGF